MKDIELQTEAFKRYIQECDELSITPDYASAFNAAWNARAAVEADRAQRVPDVAEIRRVLACVKSSVDSGIPVTDGWRILDALLASTPAQPAPQPVERKPMTEDDLVDGFCGARHSNQFVSVFIAGARFAERHHGIRE